MVEKAGRRPLLLGGMGAMTVALVILTIALVLQAKFAWLSYISIATMVVFVIGFAIGLGMSASIISPLDYPIHNGTYVRISLYIKL